MNNIYLRRTTGANGAYSFCFFLIFMSFLLSMKLWIGWDGRSTTLNYIISVLLIGQYLSGKIQLVFNKRNIVSFLVFLVSQIIVQESFSVFLVLFLLLKNIPLFFILCLNDNRKVECLGYISKYLAYILIPGIFIYALLSFIDFPPLNILCVNSNNIGFQSDGYLFRKNYLFYEPTLYSGYRDSIGFMRFNGPFHEPGHLGMMCAFLLYANQFDFKKRYLWIIVLSILFSFSLAGYVLAFMGFIMVRFYQGKISLSRLLLFALIVGGVYLGATFYNDGDNSLNNAIFERLQYDEETGRLSGDNRATELMRDYYLFMLQGDVYTLLFGYDSNTVQMMMESGGRGVGFVYWMVLHGIIGVVAAATFYVYFMQTSKDRKFAILSFVMICLMFAQRSYPFWSSWVILYVYGIAFAERKMSLAHLQRQ